MKKIFLRNLGQVVVAVTLAVAGPTVFAAWDLGGCTDSLTTDPTGLGSKVTCANPDVVLYGYSNQTDTTTTSTDTINGKNFSAAYIYDWGSAGLGVVATSESAGATGPHAADNKYGIDAMMFEFTGGAVNLTGLTIGWNGSDNPTTSGYNDSDLSVFVWTGDDTPTNKPLSSSTTTSTNPTNLVSGGWSLVGNYTDVGLSNGKYDSSTKKNAGGEQGISSSKYSSYWLVSTYSKAYGNDYSQGTDAFKLLSLAGNTCSGTVNGGLCNAASTGGGNGVPEPGSLALMGAAMMGFVASRRRKQQAA